MASTNSTPEIARRRRRAGAVLLVSLVLLAGVLGAGLRSPGASADLAGTAQRAPAAPAEEGTAGPLTTSLKPPPAVDDPVTTTTGAAEPAPPPAPVGRPVALGLPSIDVVSPVVEVGLEEDRSMELPGAREAGWYVHGPSPGSHAGSAVIAAHVDYNGTAGVFFNLRLVEIGETVTVTDDLGTTHAFTITERFQVDKDDLPTADLFRRDGQPTLTLITCGGAFSESDRRYADNIVVRAVPA